MAKPQHTHFDYDLIVIGSGAGGSPAATIAAGLGLKVAIIEGGVFGGESPNWGDVPTKALLHAVQLYDEAKNGARFGIRSTMLGYNYPSLQAWKELAVKRTGAGGNRRYYEKHGVSAFNGIAHFLSPNEISVNRRHISAERFLIATGSHWELPEIAGLEALKYLTPKSILSMNRIPKSLFIIGGGSTAIEIAQLMATFGTKVYIAEIASRLLPKEDIEVGELLKTTFTDHKGMTILTQARILSVEKDGISKRVTFMRGGEERAVRVEEVLVAAGRTPTVDLGLENAGVSYTSKGI